MLAVTLCLAVADFLTWIQLNIAVMYGLPLVLAAPTRSPRLVWTLAASLAIITFAVYALQIPPHAFLLREPFFVNRVFDVASLLLIAALIHIGINSARTREAQAELIKDQNEKLEAAKASRRLVEAQETERRELANELHDLVGQKLTALSINLSIIKMQSATSTSAPIGARLDDSLKLVEETTASIRDVMMTLRPAVLDDYGLPAALRWYAEQFVRRTGIPTTVIEHGSSRRLAPVAEETLFRIAQEALGNAAKYAGAGTITLTLDTAPDASRLTIADDGCGFDPSAHHPRANSHGWGLMIMRERAGTIGADLIVDSAPGCGTRIIGTVKDGASSGSIRQSPESGGRDVA